MPELAIGWREAVLVAVVVVSVFLGYSVLKLAQLRGRDRQAGERPESHDAWREDVERRLAALRSEVEALRVEVGQLRAARQVSPQYGEAMSLAQSGLAAEEIATRCGISVAEAQLVRALGTSALRPEGGDG